MRLDSPTSVLRRLAGRYAEVLREHLGDRLVSVVLFGPVARGEAGPDSDIDPLIVARDLHAGHFSRKRLLERADAAFAEDLRAAGAATSALFITLRPLYTEPPQATARVSSAGSDA